MGSQNTDINNTKYLQRAHLTMYFHGIIFFNYCKIEMKEIEELKNVPKIQI